MILIAIQMVDGTFNVNYPCSKRIKYDEKPDAKHKVMYEEKNR